MTCEYCGQDCNHGCAKSRIPANEMERDLRDRIELLEAMATEAPSAFLVDEITRLKGRLGRMHEKQNPGKPS